MTVSTKSGDIPFSAGYLAAALLGIGISYETAYLNAFSISKLVVGTGKDRLTSAEIMDITINWYEKHDKELAERVKIMTEDFNSIKPLIILLGGVTGIGKSTISQVLGERLGIKSIIGTDLIRELLRVTISKDLMPSLHTSSYIAYEQLDTSFMPALAESIVGFEEQARFVVVGIEAAIERAIDDNELMVIEGVHLVPGLIKSQIVKNDCVLQIQLHLEDENIHRSRLKRREGKSHNRGTSYSQYFDNIREIQQYLHDQAIKHDIPIITVDDDEKALALIMKQIWKSKVPSVVE